MSSNPSIIVGVTEDATQQRAALTFAARAALLRGVGITIVHGRVPDNPHIDSTPQERYERGLVAVQEAADHVREVTGDAVPVSAANVAQVGAHALTSRSDSAVMVVVARHRHRSGARLATASTVGVVASQAQCPVVVVPEGSLPGEAVVVGVDPEGRSRIAVRAAAAEAACRGVPLTALQLWEVPMGGPEFPMYVPAGSEEAERARQDAERNLAEATAGLGEIYPALVIHRRLVRGSVVPGLLEAGRDASVLVVGRHRTARLRTIGLGRVARRLVAEANCPVMVTPEASRGFWADMFHRTVPAGQHY